MPKTEIDYSNTIIYKITCKDSNITDVYVGHTTNFVQRKHTHKQNCINVKAPNYKCKLYEVIRNNGGWDNWKIEIINFFNCLNHYEARKKEQEYFVSLNANLNSIEPMPKQNITSVNKTEPKTNNIFYCKKCNIHCNTAKLFEIHNNTKKHNVKIQIVTKEPLKPPKKPLNYICENCNFNTSNKKDYSRHLLTDKHFSLSNPNLENPKKPKPIIFNCICGKSYKHLSSLCGHKKKCNSIKTPNETEIINNNYATNKDETNKDELINYLIKENQEFKNLILEIIKKDTYNNSNNNNSHNKTFNLQFFLNETCKDAMNIMDFVESIKVQLCDLEKVGQIGYVEGISNIIVKHLNSLDETKRPVHCTDAKREVLYVKDEDKWEKENNDKQKLRKVIKEVAYKNSKMLKEYKSKHPDCDKGDSKFSDQYNKLIIEAMGGKGDNDLEKEDKIIKNIAKEVTIDK